MKNTLRHSSRYTDDETGLLYYGYRYYSPALGKWLSPDPIEESGGMNVFGFLWKKVSTQRTPSYTLREKVL